MAIAEPALEIAEADGREDTRDARRRASRERERPVGVPADPRPPRLQPTRRIEQAVDVAVLEPQRAELVQRAVVCERFRETDAVDPAGRGTRDDVDHDTCLHTLLSLHQL